MSKNGPKWTDILEHFLTKWTSYESSGHIHRLKSMAYGSSLYDIFGKNIDLTCIFQSTLRFFSKTLFFIWSRLRCVYSTHTICSTHAVCSTHTQCLFGRHTVSLCGRHTGQMCGRRAVREYSGATPSPPSTHSHTPDIATLRCRGNS